MKVAFVYDRVNKWGGAERVLLALHAIWPDAPLYTAVYDPVRAPWASVFTVRPSWMQSVPFARSHHEFFPWLTPFAFEMFTFDPYDVVISVTSAEAKTVITKPETLHICYCLTPTRYLWSGQETYRKYPGMGRGNLLSRHVLAALTPRLRKWDLVAASRPDYYIAISERVRQRIQTYYGRRSEAVIYPPVDTALFGQAAVHSRSMPYFLLVSRLVGYKRIDLVIDACTAFRLPLVVIGRGMAERELRRRAGPTVSFVTSYLTDQELAGYYGGCQALIAAGEEDFGLTVLEAGAMGKPVIVCRTSGAAELVSEGSTGVFYSHGSGKSIREILRHFDARRFDTVQCKRNARVSEIGRFSRTMRETVERLLLRYTSL
ncbi:glycosyltransferase [Patescibacteria group bacterium]|nr:glycosyltransferase [Patescibacteria group bacterium]